MGHPFWLAGFVLKVPLAFSLCIVLLCNLLDLSFVKAQGALLVFFNTLGCMLSASEDLKILLQIVVI